MTIINPIHGRLKIEMPDLDNKQFMRHGGSRCPACSSTDIENLKAIQADDDYAWQWVTCEKCKAEWCSVYRLSGYDSLTKEIS